MPSIGEVLNRRTDLSTFCVHLTRGRTPRANLIAILANGVIEARNPMGWARDQATALGGDAMTSQKVACFSETPLEHIYSLVASIDGRQIVLQPYGLAFTKMALRRKGGNPVWYIDETPGRDWNVAWALDALRSEAQALGASQFASHQAARVFPFCEYMGTWPSTGNQKEFWWEREWRHVGDFRFGLAEVALIIAPEVEHRKFIQVFGRPCIDAAWSLERMIAALVGLTSRDVSPFSA
jgi:hypothetical protein